MYTMASICKFGKKCNNESCKRKHDVSPCTNPICIKANKEHTHPFEECGKPGGPKNEDYKASKEAAKPKTVTPTQLVCEQIYIKINKINPDKAGKITGMLKDGCELCELIVVLSNENNEINDKIKEALEVLAEAEAKA